MKRVTTACKQLHGTDNLLTDKQVLMDALGELKCFAKSERACSSIEYACVLVRKTAREVLNKMKENTND